MRVFFAIEFEEDVKKYLHNIQNEVREYSTTGNFTLTENFHLTLRFIGEQTERQIEQLKAVLEETAENTRPFKMAFSGIGSFNKGNRKIVWLGLGTSRELSDLYTSLEGVLVKSGYAKEDRAYNPHITLVREARIDNIQPLKSLITAPGPVIKVNSISLMESKRIDNKLSYVPLAQEKLIDSRV